MPGEVVGMGTAALLARLSLLLLYASMSRIIVANPLITGFCCTIVLGTSEPASLLLPCGGVSLLTTTANLSKLWASLCHQEKKINIVEYTYVFLCLKAINVRIDVTHSATFE